LPLLFGASSAASAGAAAAIVVDPEDAGPARRLGVGAALVANAVFVVMERRLGMLGEPYKEAGPGRLTRLSKALTLGGAAVLCLGGRRRGGAVAGGGLVLAGEVCLRWAVFKAGFRSAQDPRHTVEPQRERVRSGNGHASPPPSGA
jgi:hypothetical protein